MKNSTLTAVILAAGRGERLRPLTDTVPKALVRVGEEAILARMLRLLHQSGIGKVVIVVGYRSNRIRHFASRHYPELSIRIVRNHRYASTNTIYSLWLAQQAVGRGGFLLLDGDLVFEAEVLHRVVAGEDKGCAVACDSSVTTDNEAVVARGDLGGAVRMIGKSIAAEGTSFGESIGLARIGQPASVLLFRYCRELIKEGGEKLYYESAFQQLIESQVPFQAIDVSGLKWAEIDNKRDLQRAKTLFANAHAASARG